MPKRATKGSEELLPIPSITPHPSVQTALLEGTPLPPQPLVAQLQLEAPRTLLKVFMTFSHLKYGPLPRTGRRRRVPANLLIYKSIWQGTINSIPTAGGAEGGVSSPWGRQEGPLHQHTPCPAEPSSLCAQQPGPAPFPSLTGTNSPIPHSQTPSR